MSKTALINKYRPVTFDDVMGHAEMVAALKRNLAGETRAHTFLLTGSSGVGKTTIARIIATEVGAEVLEIDAASNNGAGDMRDLVQMSQHVSMSGAGLRMLIIDECHTLSKQAWQALLKLLEEPPEHLFIALCTTELEKVPETIRTRCFHVVLKAVPLADIEDLLTAVADIEGWQVNNDVFNLLSKAAMGSPRRGLALLEVAHDAPSRAEALRIIELEEASEQLIELCQYCISGGKDWDRVKKILEGVDDDQFDTGLISMGRYIITVMLRSDPKKAEHLHRLLGAITYPVNTFDRRAAFFVALGRMIGWE
jgi:DNA polymerase III gamma/tau subunit